MLSRASTASDSWFARLRQDTGIALAPILFRRGVVMDAGSGVCVYSALKLDGQ